MIVFLDFDGVMHEIACTSKNLFRHAPLFSAVLRDHPDIEVVISSDWRKDAGSVAELTVHFDLDVRHRFVGLTGIEGKEPRQRERDCWQWLRAHGREHVRRAAVIRGEPTREGHRHRPSAGKASNDERQDERLRPSPVGPPSRSGTGHARIVLL